ncbi:MULTISPECIES: bifunctional adenosylcobinamide kinase/adenosylcobinamide-phosphate guanylyltransferase [unclassified Simplicispira]|uniref:bifunctional adenosylcobinamide kinase/adenosylcobinamide-phosphate guanylyltransferase n=1 Tax=unclassified Simplicispira TaxID=2630407 RepID=UPI000D5C44D4|nr:MULTISPECIES: bifunctional adenosylcobinamide kinase/adenosylcobinamide-phosphate guanylyltransferase [unclassified Simplicispira]PVY55163.1 adenosylcobinamide kinase /adenosylcobinamide-phosphate guanylyltransferase [Simplicispira sp. 125]REG16106.1 adenosylcobinamide kinase /adenosylcobinamide-phosphate guanylyltransferase [Simplicispira sp. 110]
MTLSVARSELILGGQKSGKSRRAEALAAQWLAASPAHRALLIATAEAHDEEMRQRIARHQSDRAARVPRMQTLEEPRDLARVLVQRGAPDTLIVVDCLTLWLTHWMFGFDENLMQKEAPAHNWPAQAALFFEALAKTPGPVVLVGNEIGLGVIPLGSQVRAFVDALGVLNQQAAQACARATLMVSGLPLTLKDTP